MKAVSAIKELQLNRSTKVLLKSAENLMNKATKKVQSDPEASIDSLGECMERLCKAYLNVFGVHFGSTTGLQLHDLVIRHWKTNTGKDWTDLLYQTGVRHIIRIWSLKKHRSYETNEVEVSYLVLLGWRGFWEILRLMYDTKAALGLIPLSKQLLDNAEKSYLSGQHSLCIHLCISAVDQLLFEYFTSKNLTMTKQFKSDHVFPPCYEWVNPKNIQELVEYGKDPAENYEGLKIGSKFIIDFNYTTGEARTVTLRKPPKWYSKQFINSFNKLVGLLNATNIDTRDAKFALTFTKQCFSKIKK